MLNKFYKRIHNKFSRFFEFIFFLRYLLIIFFIAITIFLTIPLFFNYEKKMEVIQSILLENYNFKLNNFKNIKYEIFPLPNLQLINAKLNFNSSEENLSVKKIKLFLNFYGLYNIGSSNINKIILEDSEINSSVTNLNFLIKQLFYKKNNLYFDNLKLKIIEERLPLITLNGVEFANFGYKKNKVTGKIFDKNFVFEFDNNYENFKIKLINSGIDANINLNKNQKGNVDKGLIKLKILNTNLKSNFEYDGKVIKIYNSKFRSKFLSLNNQSEIVLNPFLDIKSKIDIEEFDAKIFKKINLSKFFELKDFIRKINYRGEINFKSNKFDRSIFDDLNLNLNLAYGRISFSKKLSSAEYFVQCDGNLNFLEENPLLFFDCDIESKNKRKFLKKFSIKTINKNKIFELKVKGNLSVLNRKVNFKNISTNGNYEASKEDLKYFNDIFENIIIDKNLLGIFDLKKIKKFIIEIS